MAASCSIPTLMLASLDHAIWFHRRFRADDWLLYAQDSPTSGAGRAFCRGTFFTREGELVASTAQEGLVRERKALNLPKLYSCNAIFA